jgi:putative DNA primase/helicase
MTAPEFVERLSGVEAVAKGWIACCPAHADRDPSLSIAEKDGKVLVHCHAGCSTDAIVQAVGLTMSDLFEDCPKRSRPKKISAIYSYTDEEGEVLFQAIRFQPKDFSYRTPDDTKKGGYRWDLKDVRRVLYRLPAIVDAKTVWLVEGEKDVHSLLGQGVEATCNPMGAGNWLPEYTEALKGKNVAIVRDMDLAGARHAHRVYQELCQAGCTVRILEPAKGKDVSDHLAAGLSLKELANGDAAKIAEIAESATSLLTSPGDYSPTDIGRAKQLVDEARHLRYCPDRKCWYSLNSHIWDAQPAGHDIAIQESIRIAQQLAQDAKAKAKTFYAAGDSEGGKEAMREAAKVESAATVRNMASLASTFPAIIVRSGDLDADRNLLGCANGILDVDTGKLVGGSHYVTRTTGIDYDPSAKAPIFERYLAQIMQDDDSLIEFMQMWMGYALSGRMDEHALLFLYGQRARNGKSTLLKTLSNVLGRYVGPVDKRLLIASSTPPPQFSVAGLESLRIAVASEVESSTKLNTEFVKALTSGDTMWAERKGENGYDFRPCAKLVWAVNRLPDAQFDAAFRARLFAVPFDQSFYAESDEEWREGDLAPDDQLEYKIAREAPGILAAMVRWRRAYLDRGRLPRPIKVQATAHEYEQDTDTLALWIAERCEMGSECRAQAMDLFEDYVRFCKRTGTPVSGRYNDFVNKLKGQKSIQHGRPQNKSTFFGIQIVATEVDSYWKD